MAVKKTEKKPAKAPSLIPEGRGLGALLARQKVGRVPVDSEMIRLDEIRTSPDQPRKAFDEEALDQLVQSIKNHGLLQPVIVTPSDGSDGTKYRIIAGERRYRACLKAGLSSIPARVVRGDEKTLSEIALVENLQRRDLTLLETASALKSLMEKYGLTQEQLAQRLGWSRAAIANKTRILALPDAVLGLIEEGKLSEGHAKLLLSIDDGQRLLRTARSCAENGWSVRALEERLKSPAPQRAFKPWRPEGARKLGNELGMKITASGDGRTNRLTLSGLSRSQVERLLQLMRREKDALTEGERREG
ncbi:MAG: ParB/RepB/Spo0J family partition protein [Pyramidobacter sp.]|jgi:ParB family chromosome partitioning protein